MLASRGVCRACQARQLHNGSIRAYSSTPGRRIHLTAQSHLKRPSAGRYAVVASVLPLSQARFQSTTPLASEASSPATALAETAQPSWDIPAAAEVADISTREFGFLKALGLDFGWGPTSTLQWLFEHVYIWGGTPMWASIVLTGALWRMGMIPLIMQSSDTAARMKAMSSIAQPKMNALREAAKKQDQMAMQKHRAELREVYQASGIKMWKMAMPLMQLPLGFGQWRLLRNMSDVPVPGMRDGGLLWFTNLTVPDPLYLLPFITAGLQYFTMKQSIAMGANPNRNPQLEKFMLYGLPCISLPVIAFQPAAIGLSFTVTAAIALLTNQIIRRPAIRGMFGLAPMVETPPPGPAPSPYKGAINISPAARDHPENVKMQRAAAEAALVNVPLGQKLKFSYLRNRTAKFLSSSREGLDKMLPGSSSTSDSRKKLQNRQAESYEQRRSREIREERKEYEREMRHRRRQ